MAVRRWLRLVRRGDKSTRPARRSTDGSGSTPPGVGPSETTPATPPRRGRRVSGVLSAHGRVRLWTPRAPRCAPPRGAGWRLAPHRRRPHRGSRPCPLAPWSITADPDVLDDLLRLAAPPAPSWRSLPTAGPRGLLGQRAVRRGARTLSTAAPDCGLPRRAEVVLLGRDLDDAGIWQRAVEVGRSTSSSCRTPSPG
jgi:hypothetical protein